MPSEICTFNILTWSSFHSIDENEEVYNIRLFGKTQDGQNVHVRLTEYTPFFYVEIPDKWTKYDVLKFVGTLKNMVYKNYRSTLKTYDIVKKHKFVGFTNGELFTFIRLIFTSHTGMKKYSWALKKEINGKIYNQYESNIEPFMRCMHIQNVSASGWVEISNYVDNDENINCEINITTEWTNMKPYTNDSIAPFIIASYDIECISVSEDFPLPEIEGNKIIQIGTTFKRYGEQHSFYKHLISLKKCGNIDGVDVESYKTESEVLMAWKKLVSRLNPDIVIGYNIFGFDDKYLKVRSKVTKCQEQFEYLGRIDEKTEFVVKELSSAALGDNKMYFYDMGGRVRIDLMKVIMRDHKLPSYTLDNVAAEFIKEKISNIELVKTKNGKINIKLTTSSTNGLLKDGYISIVIDDGLAPSKLLDELQNDIKFKINKVTDNMIRVDGTEHQYNMILENIEDDKYTVYWCQAKDAFNHKDMKRLCNGSPNDRAIIGKYCIKDCELVSFIFTKLEIMANNIGMSNVCSVPLSYIFMRGQSIKALSLVAKKCRQKNTLIPVLNKKQKNDDDEDEFKDGYAGAIVFDPEPGIYYTPTVVLDYASLYPSSMIERNLSHDMIITQNKYDNIENISYHDLIFENIKCIETQTCKKHCSNKKCSGRVHTIYDARKNECTDFAECLEEHYKSKDGKMVHYSEHCKIHCIMHCTKTHCVNTNCLHKHELVECTIPGCKQVHCSVHCRFAYDKERKDDKLVGIVVEILKDLLTARKSTKKLMATETNKFKYNVLDGLQSAYKITANSIYGQIGSSVSAISFPQIAAAVTSTGRERLIFAKNMVEQNYDAKVIYGDTDSIFVKFGIYKEGTMEYDLSKEALGKAIELGKEVSNFVNSKLPYPHNLEYEKVFYPWCILNKKKYVGNLYEHDPNKFKQKSMGIVLKRRDNANIVKIVVGGIVDIILNEQDFDKALEFTKKSIDNLLLGKYTIDKFIITKTLKSNYKDPTQIAHKVLADRIGERDPGNKPQINDRIPFVYVKTTTNNSGLQGDKIEHPDYVIKHGLEIDYLFYLTNQIMNPAIQFLEMGAKDVEKIFLNAIYAEENKRKNIKTIDNWFKPSKNSNQEFNPTMN